MSVRLAGDGGVAVVVTAAIRIMTGISSRSLLFSRCFMDDDGSTECFGVGRLLGPADIMTISQQPKHVTGGARTGQEGPAVPLVTDQREPSRKLS